MMPISLLPKRLLDDALESEELAVPITDISAVVENIIFLRYQEDAARRSRVISILKVRESGHDPTLRAFTITGKGIVIAPDPPPASEE